MRRHTRTVGVIGVLSLVTSVAATPVAADTALYGFHQDLDYFGSSAPPRVDLVASIGARVSRSTLLWRVHEPSPDTLDWTRSDIVNNKLRAEGIQPLWYIGSSPSWANGSSDPWVVPDYPSAAFDTWSDRVAAFAAAAATRYPGSLWEVWNEPNERFFWKPAPNREAYSVLYRKVRAAILGADPTAKVAVGGLTGLNAGCCLRGYDFLEEMLQAGDPIDYVAIHPYAGDNQAPDDCVSFERNFRDIALMRQLLNDYGNDAPLWVTEFGWRDTVGDGEATQAAYLARAHEMLQSGRMRLCPQHSPTEEELDINVTVSTWFFDIDTANFPTHGVFTEEGERKLAADAFEAFVNSLPPDPQWDVMALIHGLPTDVDAYKSRGHLIAMLVSVEIVQRFVDGGWYHLALRQLESLHRRVDGCADGPPPDHDDSIVDCEAQDSVRRLMERLMASLMASL
ncbi:MAG: hypothetical protein GEU99_19910 [Luteitalea sp.]|nr:hypothetical protein [Luteitalea sp.]